MLINGTEDLRVQKTIDAIQKTFEDMICEMDYEKIARMDETVDDIRKRFGTDALMRAAFLNQPINHMSGGIANALKMH